MLDETIVNVIVRRNLDDHSKLASPKWKRTIRTVEWLTANLPKDSSLQIYTFNTSTTPVIADLHGKWIPANDARQPPTDRTELG